MRCSSGSEVSARREDRDHAQVVRPPRRQAAAGEASTTVHARVRQRSPAPTSRRRVATADGRCRRRRPWAAGSRRTRAGTRAGCARPSSCASSHEGAADAHGCRRRGSSWHAASAFTGAPAEQHRAPAGRAAGRAPPANCSGRLCVWSKNANRPGKGVSVHAKLNSPQPTPIHGCMRQQRERAGPDAEARARQVRLVQLRTRRRTRALRGRAHSLSPIQHSDVHERHEPQASHAREAATSAGRSRPTARASTMHTVPVREDGQHHTEHQQQRDPHGAGARREAVA